MLVLALLNKAKQGEIEMPQGVEESHLNAVISTVLKAAYSFWESTIEEVLRPLSDTYGKGDTLGMDAMPEITIVDGLRKYDKFSVVVTEEASHEFTDLSDPRLFRTVFICDPTDRSTKIKEIFSLVPSDQRKKTVAEIIDAPDFRKTWEDNGSNPMEITGGCSAVTCVRRGVPIFSVIVNYMTRKLFVACDAGCYCFEIPKIEKKLDLTDVLKGGEKIFFNGSVPHDAMTKFTTYLGKREYLDNFLDSRFITEEDIEANLLYNLPGGPSRVLYLSTLQENNPIGFIMANGEKITEWIHWLPYVKFARQECNQGEPVLQLYEVYQNRPWTKDNILMSTPPAYSIFKIANENNQMIIDVGRFPAYGNPSRIRGTLVVCPINNSWTTKTVNQFGYRRIDLFSE